MAKRISEFERLARRRLGYITPMSSGKVLAHPRYWTLAFLRLYLDLCDETTFHCAEEGYLLGQPAAELARRIGIQDGGYGNDQERLDWRVRALAVWGSCCRAHGQLTESRAAYRRAFELVSEAHGDGLSPYCLGDLHTRYAVFCLTTGRAEALTHLNQAVDRLEGDLESGRPLADALAIRGLVRYLRGDVDSLEDLARSLKWLQPRTPRGRRTLISVLHNMALAISRGGMTTEAQELAYRLLTHCQKQLQRPRSVQRHKMLWLEGLLLARLGITRLAERRLLKAYGALVEADQSQDLAALSLDLVCFYLTEADLGRAKRFTEVAYQRVTALCDHLELSAFSDPCPSSGQGSDHTGFQGFRAEVEAWRRDPSFNRSKALQEQVYHLTFGRSLLQEAGPGSAGPGALQANGTPWLCDGRRARIKSAAFG